MFYLLHWIDKLNQNKDHINVFLTKDEVENFKKEKNLTEELFFSEEYINENANNKLIISYAKKVLKRMKLIMFKTHKNSSIELESEEYYYDIFKINEFWCLTKIKKNPEETDYYLHQSTSLKKLIKQHYE